MLPIPGNASRETVVGFRGLLQTVIRNLTSSWQAEVWEVYGVWEDYGARGGLGWSARGRRGD